MKLDNKELMLYLVTDRTWLKEESLESVVETALKNGVSFVQLREKDLSFEDFKDLADKIKSVTDKYHIPLVINDNIKVAVEVATDGVHIGQGDMDVKEARDLIGPEKILGVSAETLEQAKRAEEDGADYIGVGAIFPTGSKDDARSVSIETLKKINKGVNIPVVAIGGINHENIEELGGSEIDGVAVISAILAKEDPGKAARDLRKLADKFLGGE